MTRDTPSLGKFDVALGIIAAFTAVIASTYVVLWHESNRSVWMLAGCCLAFGIALLLSRNRTYVLCVGFGFTALRFAIAAIATQSLKLGAISLLLVSVVAVVVVFHGRS